MKYLLISLMLVLSVSARASTEELKKECLMCWLAEIGYWEEMRRLIDKEGGDPDAADEQGKTAIMYAATEGYGNAVKLLLSYCADVDAIDIDGKNVLIYAAGHGHAKIVERLIKHGVELNKIDSRGFTALIGSAFHNHGEITHLLLTNGADPDIKDKRGKIAWDYAQYNYDASEAFENWFAQQENDAQLDADIETINNDLEANAAATNNADAESTDLGADVAALDNELGAATLDAAATLDNDLEAEAVALGNDLEAEAEAINKELDAEAVLAGATDKTPKQICDLKRSGALIVE